MVLEAQCLGSLCGLQEQLHTEEVKNPIVAQHTRLHAAAVSAVTKDLEGSWRVTGPLNTGSLETLLLLTAQEPATAIGETNWAARGKARQEKMSNPPSAMPCFIWVLPRRCCPHLGWIFPHQLRHPLVRLPPQVTLICGKLTLKTGHHTNGLCRDVLG